MTTQQASATSGAGGPASSARRRGRRGRRRAILLAGAGVLLAGLVVLFHPAFQRWLVLEQLGPRVDRLEIGRLHVLPWSVFGRDLLLVHDGVQIQVPQMRVRVQPLALLAGRLGIREISASAVSLDLRGLQGGEAAPPASPAPPAPFPGVLALADPPLPVYVDALDVSVDARLPGDVPLALTLGGGGIAPGGRGRVEVGVRLEPGNPIDRFELAGPVLLSQSAAGDLTEIAADLRTVLVPTLLAREEQARLTVSVSPSPQAASSAEAGADAADREPVPERLVLDVALPERDGRESPARLHVEGRYDGGSGIFDGRYELSADYELVRPYVDAAAVPAMDNAAGGRLLVDLTSNAFSAEVGGEVTVTALERPLGRNAALPTALRLRNDISVRLAGGRLLVERLHSTLMHVDDGTRLLDVSLAGPLDVPLSDPWAALAQNRSLGVAELTGVPLVWLDGRLAGVEVSGGMLRGRFSLAARDGALEVTTDRPLELEEAELRDAGELLARFDAAVAPSLRRSRDALRAELADLHLEVAGERALDAEVTATLAIVPPGGAGERPLGVVARATGVLGPLLEMPVLARLLPPTGAPGDLRVALDVSTTLEAAAASVEVAELSVYEQRDAPVLALEALQPFRVPLGGAADPGLVPARFENPDGELLSVAVSRLEASWFAPLVKGWDLAGTLEQARFVVSAADGARLRLVPDAPLALGGLAVTRDGEALVDGLDLTVLPEVTYGEDSVSLAWEALEVRGRSRPLLSGRGRLGADALSSSAPRLQAAGRALFDAAGLEALPVLSKSIQAGHGQRDLRADADFRLEHAAGRTRVDALDGRLDVAGTTRARIELVGAPLLLRSDLPGGENLARVATGSVRVTLDGLASAMLEGIVPMPGVSFTSADGAAELVSDGEHLQALVTEPFVLSGVTLRDGEGVPMLRPFTVSAAASLEAAGRRYQGDLSQLALRFAGDEATALSGRLEFAVEPDRPIPLQSLSASLEGALPALLDQPLLLPGHRLRTGHLTSSVTVTGDGSIEAHAVVDRLTAPGSVALDRVVADAGGNVAPDGSGFDLTIPVFSEGRSGRSDLAVAASWARAPDAASRVSVKVDSERLALNDIVATAEAIRRRGTARAPGRSAGAGTEGTPAGPEAAGASLPALDTTPDDHAFWDLLPLDALLEVDIAELQYNEDLRLHGITTRFELTPTLLSLTDAGARYYDSPLRFDGVISFDGEREDVYDVDVEGRVSDFDFTRFLTELSPDTIPVIEGLFSMSIDAFGRSPNASQLRNRVLFDATLRSTEGVYRLLDPNSALVSGTTGAVGVIGDALSYVPTSLFGVATAARLVGYVRELEYDLVDIRVHRQRSLDLEIERFLVQSPTLRITAEGGIEHVPGEDVLHSPLTLSARLNAREKGAAILHGLGLLEREEDEAGYWQGPEYTVTGSVVNQQSNLEEIIDTARGGTLFGSLGRPFAGLVGNFRHRWFGKAPAQVDAPPLDAPAGAAGDAAAAPQRGGRAQDGEPEDGPRD